MRFGPYIQNYKRYAAWVVATVITTFLSAAWLTTELLEYLGCTNDPAGIPFEPAISLIVAIAAGATPVVLRLRELRSRVEGTRLEEMEDLSFDPWTSVNHSFNRIEYTLDVDPRSKSELNDFLVSAVGCPALMEFGLSSGLCILERLREETGTDNYRLIRPIGADRLVKVFKGYDPTEIRLRELVGECLERQEVFESGFRGAVRSLRVEEPTRTGQYVVHGPDETSSAWWAELPAGAMHRSPVVIQLFPYVDAKHHYRGHDIRELGSAARLFARVNHALGDLGPTGVELARQLRDPGRYAPDRVPPSVREPTVNELLSGWDAIRTHLRSGTRLSQRYPGIESQVQLIDDAVHAAASSLALAPPTGTRCYLHDLHPHNTLFIEPADDGPTWGAPTDRRLRTQAGAARSPPAADGRRCVLIYDYSWVGAWNHETVVAYSMHRFVREYVRQHVVGWPEDASCIVDARDHLIREGCDVFLGAYCAEWRMSMNAADVESCDVHEQSFKANAFGYIARANMNKLIRALKRESEGLPDALERSQDRARGELYKFVRFMAEAREFGKALNLSPRARDDAKRGDGWAGPEQSASTMTSDRGLI